MTVKTLIKIGAAAAVLLASTLPAHTLVASQDHDHEAAAGEATRYELIMDEFNFAVEGQTPGEPLVVRAGQTIELKIVNVGVIFHEAMFGREASGDHGYHENFFDGVEVKLAHHMTMGQTERAMEMEADGLTEVELDPDMAVVLTFTVPETYAGGVFEIGCFVPGHYEAGMKLALLVLPADDDHDEDGDTHEDEGGHADHEDDHDDEPALADADNDGVPDEDDYCPTYPGEPLKNGC